MLKSFIKLFLSFVITFNYILSGPLFAVPNYMRGGELNYRHIGGTLYEINITVYGDRMNNLSPTGWGGGMKFGNIAVAVESMKLGINIFTHLPVMFVPKDSFATVFSTNMPCPSFGGNLLDCSAIRPMCYIEHYFQDTIDLADYHINPYTDDWKFIAYQGISRPTPYIGVGFPCGLGGSLQIYNLNSDKTFALEARLDNLHFPGNTSAFWNNHLPNYPGHTNDTILIPLGYSICEDILYDIGQRATEYDGDSISYEFVQPLEFYMDSVTRNCSPPIPVFSPASIYFSEIPYWPPYNLAHPLPHYPAPGFSIDPYGTISFIPAPVVIPYPPAPVTLPVSYKLPSFAVAVRVNEYRRDAANVMRLVGSASREITIWISDSCRKDYIHMKPDTAICGDSIITMRFGPNANEYTRVRCNTISPFGSEFRVIDSSQSPPRVIGFAGVNWKCGDAGGVDKIQLALAEKLHNDGEYYVVLRNGSDLNVLESECGYWLTEHTSVRIHLKTTLITSLNVPDTLVICHPSPEPYPLLKASNSGKNTVNYEWRRYNVVFPGHTIDSIWAEYSGEYTVQATDEYNCIGTIDTTRIYFKKTPEFVFDLPPYCDTTLFPDPGNLPKFLRVPDLPNTGTWHWQYDFGPPLGFDTVQTGDSLTNVLPGKYKLVYIDTLQEPRSFPCPSVFEFKLNREVHPPESPLIVDIKHDGELELCKTENDKRDLFVIDSLLKPNFKTKPGYPDNRPYRYHWYKDKIENPVISIDSQLVAVNGGVYYLIVQDQYGCKGIDSVEIVQGDKYPAFDIECHLVPGSNAGQFIWDEIPTASGYQVSINNGISWIDLKASQFDVTNMDELQGIIVKALFPSACRESELSEASSCYIELLLPNVITPNNDGINDYFYIEFLEFYPNAELIIFDRWGQHVFHDIDYKNSWQGEGLQEGTYFYLLTVQSDQQAVFKGLITIMR